ncbi:uncharacterized protein LOC133708978 [Rosa rugosa]|uniref:uncharacterized protein LOC133708978 n=1 Tax=Rosa rugosa TaxID=74645 RepID=UPI002B402DEE|nr:uncharacterized protein LOC133708978 [Rosa rugosa]
MPDGYSSNIASRVSLEDNKILNLKSHDCHVLIQQLLSLALRGLLPKGPRVAIFRLCASLNLLCQRVIDIKKVELLDKELPETLCMLERFFPPSFFDVMVHLTIHLAQQVLIVGPVQFCWMFPFERCIAEKYLAEEITRFCDGYIKEAAEIGVQHKCNEYCEDEIILEGKPIGPKKLRQLTPTMWEIAHRYKTKALDPLDLLSLSPLSILEPSRSSLFVRPQRRWRSRHSCCAGGTTSTSRLSGKTASSTLSAQPNPLGSSVALREIRVRIGARSSLIQTHLQFKASRPGDIDEREVVTPDVMTKYFIGVTLKERSPDGVGTLVDVGLSKNVVVVQVLDPGARVTVAMGDSWNLDADISRQVVSSSKPREEAGMYWGYKVHYASNITSVMIECPYEGGYII